MSNDLSELPGRKGLKTYLFESPDIASKKTVTSSKTIMENWHMNFGRVKQIFHPGKIYNFDHIVNSGFK